MLVADYAKAFDLVDEPTFAWWAPYTLRKRDVIVSMVNARVKKRTHKYGVEVPRSLKEAIELSRQIDDCRQRRCIDGYLRSTEATDRPNGPVGV